MKKPKTVQFKRLIEQMIKAEINKHRQLTEGKQPQTPEDLKTESGTVLCKITPGDSAAPELKKLSGRYCIIMGSQGSKTNYYATALRLASVSGNTVEIEPKITELPEMSGGMNGYNGCDFSYFELFAVIKITSNMSSRKIRDKNDGSIIDNPNYNPSGKDEAEIIKKL